MMGCERPAVLPEYRDVSFDGLAYLEGSRTGTLTAGHLCMRHARTMFLSERMDGGSQRSGHDQREL